MSKPAPGNYRIINTRNSPEGQALAISYDEQKPGVLFVTKAASAPSGVGQVWTIEDYSDGETQIISPNDVKVAEMQVGFGTAGHTLQVLPPGGYVWTIRGSDGVYTIEDGDVTVFWGLNYFIPGEDVSYGHINQPGVEVQKWKFVSV